MEMEVSHEMETEGGSGNLRVMTEQSRVRTRCIDRKNPSARGEASVKVGSGKSAIDESVTETVKKEAERSGKRSEMQAKPAEFPNKKPAGKKKNRKNKTTQAGTKNTKNKTTQDEEATMRLNKDTNSAEVATQRALRARNGKLAKKQKKKKAKAVPEEESGKRSEMQRHAEEPVPDFYLSLPPDYREKVMKHDAERVAAMNKFLYGQEKRPESSNWSESSEDGILEEAENESTKRLETIMRISPETQLYEGIQRALIDIEEKLTKKKNGKMDTDTLQLLDDISNMLDQGVDDDEKDDIDESGQSATPLAKKTVAEEMADEQARFDSYSRIWEHKHGKTCGFFTDTTLLSSMQFTHYTPGRSPYNTECSTLETLQIISIKLTELAGGLELPLSVYGVVAIRDMVDRNRNILFFQDRSEAQELKQDDPFLHLIGPSRAILFKDKVCIEIELRVKGGANSEDKALMSCTRRYTGWNGPGVSTISFKNVLCTLGLCLEPVKKTVQATILGVQVAKYDGSWPLRYGGLVACTPLSGKFVSSGSRITRRINSSSSQIVLIDSKDEAMPKGEDGHLHLRRQVVSAELEGMLDVFIKAYSKRGGIGAEAGVSFYPKFSNISQEKCLLGDAEVTVTVAWSRVVESKPGLWLELSGRRCL